ncbi:MAG: LysR family transcriptional regulator [Cloacibacillus sp.]
MTLNHLRVFAAVAASGQMSAAARELHLSQPAVSQIIAELEQHYSVRLFERLAKKIYITEEGKKFLEEARRVLVSFEELEYAMLPEKRRHRLRVGSSVTVGMCVMPEVLKNFAAGMPETEIYSFVNNTETIESMLLSSELDVAVVEGRVKSPDLVTERLMDDFTVLFCAAAHPFAKQKTVTLDEACAEYFVMREHGSGTRAIFEDFVMAHGGKLKIKWEVACFDATLRAVTEEGCLGVASIRLLAPHLKSGKVRAICAPHSDWERVFSLTYHRNKYLTDSLKAFIAAARAFDDGPLPDKGQMGRLVL